MQLLAWIKEEIEVFVVKYKNMVLVKSKILWIIATNKKVKEAVS